MSEPRCNHKQPTTKFSIVRCGADLRACCHYSTDSFVKLELGQLLKVAMRTLRLHSALFASPGITHKRTVPSLSLRKMAGIPVRKIRSNDAIHPSSCSGLERFAGDPGRNLRQLRSESPNGRTPFNAGLLGNFRGGVEVRNRSLSSPGEVRRKRSLGCGRC